MKIYVIAWDYGYEGYGEPGRAFATREAAEEFVAKKPGAPESIPEIFELEVEGHVERLEEAVYSNSDQFSQFPIGQIFYPELGREAAYRFVKTGEASVVRTDQKTGETVYIPDVLAEGKYPHWRDHHAGLITDEETKLDPFPYIGRGANKVFGPRPEYSQNEEDYK